MGTDDHTGMIQREYSAFLANSGSFGGFRANFERVLNDFRGSQGSLELFQSIVEAVYEQIDVFFPEN